MDTTQPEPPLQLVTIEQDTEKSKNLIKPAREIQFPLSEQIKVFIEQLKEKAIAENAAGLAASQVGQHLRIICFRVFEASIKARSLDASEEFPLTVLINPTYQGVEEDGKNNDEWEGCFSVENICGKPFRYNTIRYTGFNIQGEPIKGTAKGFLARLIQHEIDHTNGILFAQHLTPACTQGTPQQMEPIRTKEYEERRNRKQEATK